jgi:competence protein ComEC
MLRLGMALTSPIPQDFYDARVHFSGRMLYQPERGEMWEEGYAAGTLTRIGDPERSVEAKTLIRFREPIRLRYGDHIEFDSELRRPQGKRNPGGFDYRFYLAQRQVFGVLYPDRGEAIALTRRGGFLLLRGIEALRRRVEGMVEQTHRKATEHALVLKGMLLGQRSALPQEVLDAFQDSGASHVLAVSGLHVGLIAGAIFLVLSWLRLTHKAACLLTIAAIILYACLVGFRASVLRASLMLILFLVAQLIDRDADLINLLAFAALVLLVVNPAQLWDVGFQLSFAAVGAIVYLAPRWEGFIRRLPPKTEEVFTDRTVAHWFHDAGRLGLRWLAIGFGVSLAAQVGTALFIASHFHRVYPIGLIANVFIVGLVGPIVSLTLGAVLLGMAWLPLAAPIAYINHLFMSFFLGVVRFFAGWPGAEIKTTPPTFGFIVLFAAICLGITHWRWTWERRKSAALIGLTAAAIFVWDAALRDRGNLLEVTFLDVGQGDAAFLRFPDGRTMLIDGGLYMGNYDSGERILNPFLLHEGVYAIDLLLLSHPDNDHGGGLAHILSEFRVDRVLGVPHRDLFPPTHRMLHAIVDEKGIPHELGYAGAVQLTSTAQLDLLHPFDEGSINLLDRDVNNDSLVLKVAYGKMSILFTGDIGEKVEIKLVESGCDLRATILKTPHHGSKTSSSARFLGAVRPQYAVFSLGERNRYGFPDETVVKRYRDVNCHILRTDQLGAIRLLTDGRRCWISAYAARG